MRKLSLLFIVALQGCAMVTDEHGRTYPTIAIPVMSVGMPGQDIRCLHYSARCPNTPHFQGAGTIWFEPVAP
jgi:hypothetical protein